MTSARRIADIIRSVKELAIEYYCLTGRPLGVTGEIGEYEAARLLKLEIAPVREAGFDAIDQEGRCLQIKARAISPEKKNVGSHRLGKIGIKSPWDAVLLVLMTDKFEPYAIYEANRESVIDALMKPGSKARNERGALSISAFKKIAKLVWSREKV